MCPRSQPAFRLDLIKAIDQIGGEIRIDVNPPGSTNALTMGRYSLTTGISVYLGHVTRNDDSNRFCNPKPLGVAFGEHLSKRVILENDEESISEISTSRLQALVKSLDFDDEHHLRIVDGAMARVMIEDARPAVRPNAP